MSKKSPTYASLLSHLVLSPVGPPRFSHQPYSFPSLYPLPLSFPSSSPSFLFGPSSSHPHRPKAAPIGGRFSLRVPRFFRSVFSRECTRACSFREDRLPCRTTFRPYRSQGTGSQCWDKNDFSSYPGFPQDGGTALFTMHHRLSRFVARYTRFRNIKLLG